MEHIGWDATAEDPDPGDVDENVNRGGIDKAASIVQYSQQ